MRRSSRLENLRAASQYGSGSTFLVSSWLSFGPEWLADWESLAFYGTHGGSVDLEFALSPTTQQMGGVSGPELSASTAGGGRIEKPWSLLCMQRCFLVGVVVASVYFSFLFFFFSATTTSLSTPGAQLLSLNSSSEPSEFPIIHGQIFVWMNVSALGFRRLLFAWSNFPFTVNSNIVSLRFHAKFGYTKQDKGRLPLFWRLTRRMH
jgi:hypothetical protein